MSPFVLSESGVRIIVQQATHARQISRWEYFQITSAMLANADIAAVDRTQVNRLLDAVRLGDIELVN